MKMLNNVDMPYLLLEERGIIKEEMKIWLGNC